MTFFLRSLKFREWKPSLPHPASPKGAPVETRPTVTKGASADFVNQMIESKNETNSQDAAFETWLSEQPWNRRESGDKGLNNALRKAIAKSRLADRKMTANSRDDPKG